MKLLLKRLVQFGVFLVLVLVLAVAVLHWYRPTVTPVILPASKPVSGAAVFYNQAFAAMPELSEAEKKLLRTKPEAPLDTEAATQIVAKYDACLQLLAQGAMQQQCEWGVDLSLWPSMPIPPVAKGDKLSQALGLRVRLRFLTGDLVSATNDLLLMLRFGNHLGDPALFIGNLVKIKGNAIAIDLAARNLQNFDAASLRRLSEGINALPPSHSMQEAVAVESKTWTAFFRNPLAKEMARKAQQSWFERWKEEVSDQSRSADSLIGNVIRASPTLYLLWVDRFEQKSQELVHLMGLPYVEGRPRIAAFEKALKKKSLLDPFSALALPAIFSGRRSQEVQIEAEWAILRAALEAQIHNPSTVRAELAKLRDPFDNGPIAMRDVEGGVELILKSREGQKKQVTLTVGLAKK